MTELNKQDCYDEKAEALWDKFEEGVKLFAGAVNTSIDTNSGELRPCIRGSNVGTNIQGICNDRPNNIPKLMKSASVCARDAGLVCAALVAADNRSTISTVDFEKAKKIVAKMHPAPSDDQRESKGILGRLCD